MKKHSGMLISLVVCTFNRVEILKITLPHLLKLKIPKNVFLEIIVVDNNSTDQTKKYVLKFIQENSNHKIKYVFEKQQGVSYARNTGYQNAKGHYVGYLDDECILPEEWLEVAVSTLDASHPAVLGGPYYGKFLPGITSNWCKESFGDSYILEHNFPNAPLNNHNVSEGNMIIRRDIFNKIGPFNLDYGMTGSTVAYGEGDEFQRRLREKLPDEVIWYNPELFVWHLIRNEKISMLYRFKEAIIRGQSIARFSRQNDSIFYKSPLKLFRNIYKALYSAIKKLFQSFYSREHYFSILHNDYEDGTWRNIGIEWYRTKALIKRRDKKL